MSVITISRGTDSGGKMMAECLAARLGYRCIDRGMIVEKAAVYGISQDELREALLKPPGFLDRFNGPLHGLNLIRLRTDACSHVDIKITCAGRCLHICQVQEVFVVAV